VARVALIVLDAVGVGATPDAAEYGDADASTLAHVAAAIGGLRVPNLRRLGLGNILPVPGSAPVAKPAAVIGRLRPSAAGKDSTTGHWELVGRVATTPLPTYPRGFPAEVIDEFRAATDRQVIGNAAASGTEIIQRLGAEHARTGAWIVYTSADSVFQIAAHEDVVSLDELYAACLAARTILAGRHAVGRVIARPFTGAPGAYRRTPHRRDYARGAPRPNYLTLIRESSLPVRAVGKISDLFAGADIDQSIPTATNADGVAATLRLLAEPQPGLVFTNLVDTDTLYGHRNDASGFGACLEAFDEQLPRLLAALTADDLIILTSDHGCDPTTPGTDHTREYGLLLAHAPGRPAAGRRHDGAFADVGATACHWLTSRTGTGQLAGRPIPI
jgi:phosphopentomutase